MCEIYKIIYYYASLYLRFTIGAYATHLNKVHELILSIIDCLVALFIVIYAHTQSAWYTHENFFNF